MATAASVLHAEHAWLDVGGQRIRPARGELQRAWTEAFSKGFVGACSVVIPTPDARPPVASLGKDSPPPPPQCTVIEFGSPHLGYTTAYFGLTASQLGLDASDASPDAAVEAVRKLLHDEDALWSLCDEQYVALGANTRSGVDERADVPSDLLAAPCVDWNHQRRNGAEFVACVALLGHPTASDIDKQHALLGTALPFTMTACRLGDDIGFKALAKSVWQLGRTSQQPNPVHATADRVRFTSLVPEYGIVMACVNSLSDVTASLCVLRCSEKRTIQPLDMRAGDDAWRSLATNELVGKLLNRNIAQTVFPDSQVRLRRCILSAETGVAGTRGAQYGVDSVASVRREELSVIPGASIASFLDTARLPHGSECAKPMYTFSECCEIFAHAVTFAHNQSGVVHGDDLLSGDATACGTVLDVLAHNECFVINAIMWHLARPYQYDALQVESMVANTYRCNKLVQELWQSQVFTFSGSCDAKDGFTGAHRYAVASGDCEDSTARAVTGYYGLRQSIEYALHHHSKTMTSEGSHMWRLLWETSKKFELGLGVGSAGDAREGVGPRDRNAAAEPEERGDNHAFVMCGRNGHGRGVAKNIVVSEKQIGVLNKRVASTVPACLDACAVLDIRGAPHSHVRSLRRAHPHQHGALASNGGADDDMFRETQRKRTPGAMFVIPSTVSREPAGDGGAVRSTEKITMQLPKFAGCKDLALFAGPESTACSVTLGGALERIDSDLGNLQEYLVRSYGKTKAERSALLHGVSFAKVCRARQRLTCMQMEANPAIMQLLRSTEQFQPWVSPVKLTDPDNCFVREVSSVTFPVCDNFCSASPGAASDDASDAHSELVMNCLFTCNDAKHRDAMMIATGHSSRGLKTRWHRCDARDPPVAPEEDASPTEPSADPFDPFAYVRDHRLNFDVPEDRAKLAALTGTDGFEHERLHRVCAPLLCLYKEPTDIPAFMEGVRQFVYVTTNAAYAADVFVVQVGDRFVLYGKLPDQN